MNHSNHHVVPSPPAEDNLPFYSSKHNQFTPIKAEPHRLPPTPGSPLKQANSDKGVQCLYSDQRVENAAGTTNDLLNDLNRQLPQQEASAIDNLDDLTLLLDSKLALCHENAGAAATTTSTDQSNKRKRMVFRSSNEEEKSNADLQQLFTNTNTTVLLPSHSVLENCTLGSLVTEEEKYETFPNNGSCVSEPSAYLLQRGSNNNGHLRLNNKGSRIRITNTFSYSESDISYRSSSLMGARIAPRSPMTIVEASSSSTPVVQVIEEEEKTKDDERSNHKYRFGLRMDDSNGVAKKEYLSMEEESTSQAKYGESKFDSEVPFDEVPKSHYHEDQDFVHVSKKFLSEAGAAMMRLSNEISKHVTCTTRLPEEFEICRSRQKVTPTTSRDPDAPKFLSIPPLEHQDSISQLDSKMSSEFGPSNSHDFEIRYTPSRSKTGTPDYYQEPLGFYPATRPVVFHSADV
jgi:hypothetical protein